MTEEETRKRFWKRVTRGPECWQHSGRPGSHGYAQATGWAGKTMLAHRLGWEIQVGPIPKGLWVLHRCNVKTCVRRTHLYLGTHSDNMDDVARVGHPRRKLTEAAVRHIRSCASTQSALAARYGVDQAVISSVRRRRTYRFVV